MNAIENDLLKTFTPFCNPIEICQVGNKKWFYIFGNFIKLTDGDFSYVIGEKGEYIFNNGELIVSKPEDIEALNQFLENAKNISKKYERKS
jgi:hypothetical protein